MVEENWLPGVTLEGIGGQRSTPQRDCPQHHRQREGRLRWVHTCLSRLPSPTLRRGQKRGVEGTPCPHRGCWTGTGGQKRGVEGTPCPHRGCWTGTGGQKRGVEGTPCPHRGCWTGTGPCLSGFLLGAGAPGAKVARVCEIARAGTSLHGHAQRICYIPLFLKWGK
uniref:Uncharacterized protein n=1 Tax=Mustela putorius furo TaxID=9669 RepID=M3XZY9_MUSPF